MSFVTPASLRAYRTLTGMTRAELAKILGGVSEADVLRDIERMKFDRVFLGHHQKLESILLAMDDEMDLALDVDGVPEFLFTFPNEECFRFFEPELFERFMFASVHQMFTARLVQEYRLDSCGDTNMIPTIVEIQQGLYLEHLGLKHDEENFRKRQIERNSHFDQIDRAYASAPAAAHSARTGAAEPYRIWLEGYAKFDTMEDRTDWARSMIAKIRYTDGLPSRSAKATRKEREEA